MALTHIIAHKIEKGAAETNQRVSIKEEAWSLNEASEFCFKELKRGVLQRSSKDYGCLAGDHPFQALVERLSNQSIDFVGFSHETMALFDKHLSTTDLSLNHHVIMALESLENSQVVHCYFLEQEHAQYIDHQQDIESTLVLDTSVRFGLKLNLTELADKDDNVNSRAVVLLRCRGDKQMNIFLEQASGFGNKKDIASDTDALLESINHYSQSLPEEVASFTKNQAVEYCLEQEKRGEPVAIKSLSSQLHEQLDAHKSRFSAHDTGKYTPPPKFDNFVLENNKNIKNEIIADKNRLKNFIRISGRNEQMSMSFSSSCLGDSVVYDPNTDSLIVKSIPASLKSRLVKLLQNDTTDT